MYTFYVIQCRLSLSLSFSYSSFSIRCADPHRSALLYILFFGRYSLPLSRITHTLFQCWQGSTKLYRFKVEKIVSQREKNGPEFIQQWHLRWHFIWAMAFAAFGITNTLLKMGKSKVIKSGKKTISNTIFNCNRRHASTHSRLVARSQSVPPQLRRSKKFSLRNMIQLNRAIPGWCAGSCSTINLFYSW